MAEKQRSDLEQHITALIREAMAAHEAEHAQELRRTHESFQDIITDLKLVTDQFNALVTHIQALETKYTALSTRLTTSHDRLTCNTDDRLKVLTADIRTLNEHLTALSERVT